MSRPLACPACLRRAWLAGTINEHMVHTDYRLEQLVDVLALGDQELIGALGGSRAEELRERYARWDPADVGTPPAGVVRVCRHAGEFPARLAHGLGAPCLLHVAGGVERMASMLGGPTVAIVGTRTASDYGMEVAHGLARGLAVSGVTVVSALANGIAAAAHEGALEVGGPTLTVLAGGIDMPYPVGKRALHKQIQSKGCALAELPCGARAHSWNQTARARIVVALAQLVVVVEAQDNVRELLPARLAQNTGRPIAAVPGRVTAPAAAGAHVLLRSGAQLVRDAQDVLDVLYGVGPGLRRRRRHTVPPEDEQASRAATVAAAAVSPGNVGAAERAGAGTHSRGWPEIDADSKAGPDGSDGAKAGAMVGAGPRAHPEHTAARVHRGAPHGSALSVPRRVRGEHAATATHAGTRFASPQREPALQAVLDAVGDGRDTLEALLMAGAPEQETVLALARLELGGQLVRGDAGRYVRRL